MNYFAHGRHYVAEPYWLAGTAIPDWLGVLERRVRVRTPHAQPYFGHQDPVLRNLARGIAQHHYDDGWFHQTRAFAELSLELTVALRQLLAEDPSFRPGFVGHVLVEMLLDAALIEDEPARLDAYYAALAEVDPWHVHQAVNRMAPRPSTTLAALIPRFCTERFLYDYGDDAKLLYRLNRVLGRVTLSPLPEEALGIIAAARETVRARRDELLVGEAPHAAVQSPCPTGDTP